MGRWWVVFLGLGWGAIAVTACGDDDASFTDTDGGAGSGTGGSAGSGTGGSAGSGTGGSAGSGTGGSAGSGTGGSAGSGTGGSAGSGTGGSAGSGTGGSAGSGTGGSAGSGTGGSAGSGTGGAAGTGGTSGCPATKPPNDTPCSEPALVCCYGVAPEKPVRCVPTAVDGGGPWVWKTLQARECCPSGAPQSGQQCNTPGDLKCCYGNTGFSCNQQPNPDVWEPTSCN